MFTRMFARWRRRRWTRDEEMRKADFLWGPQHREPGSGLWRLTPPCGSGRWNLWSPGAPQDDHGFYVNAPFTWHPANDEFGGDTDRITLGEIRWWLVPWMERVTRQQVLDLWEGSTEEYGEHGNRAREWGIWIQTTSQLPSARR